MPPEALLALDQADLAECRRRLRNGSKTFAAAALLLPRRVRDPATVVYAFCRIADDLIDEGADPTAALAELRARLGGIYSGTPGDDPIDRSLARVVSALRVPRALLDALLEGFAWDATGRTYRTLEDVQAYAARVAGAVGAVMTVIMGRRAPEVIARACDLGVAMQLTNIARDVGEDARRGRIYLPADWLRDAGLDGETWLRAPRPDPRLAPVVSRLLRSADVLYRRADVGIALLPRDCRFAIRAARLLYADIGRGIARAGFDSVTRRSVVPLWRKLWLLLTAVRAARPTVDAGAPPLAATRFLVSACGERP